MKRNDEISRLLREADPAESREMSPGDRARVRAAITGAALGEPAHRRYFAALAVGAALTVAAIALVAFIPREEKHTVVVAPPAKDAPPTAPLPAPAIEAAPEPVVRVQPARKSRGHERPRTTQIVFTGPEGTKILWFVGPPDAKELGS
jgi:hypothetical protein